MSRTEESRRVALDNIAVGSAITTRERTVPDLTGSKAGALPPDKTAVGNGENIAVGQSYGAERIIVKGTALLAGERLGS